MLFAAGKVGDLVFRTGLPAREAIDHAPTLWRRRFDARQLAHVGGAGLMFQKCARRCLLHHVLGFRRIADKSTRQVVRCVQKRSRHPAEAPFSVIAGRRQPGRSIVHAVRRYQPTNQRIPAIAVVCPKSHLSGNIHPPPPV
jgi:hypothetical protein